MAKTGKSVIRVIPRKYRLGDVVTVKTKLIHPQENGRFKDDKGQYIPPHYIVDFKAYYGEYEVFSLQSSSSISVNPFFDFTLKVTKNAKLKVVWRDNKNGTFENSMELKAS